MGNITFGFDVKTNDWQSVGLLPIPPRYNLADYKHRKIFCTSHQSWENICGITGQMDDNRENKKIKGFILSCRHIAYPPFIANYGKVPYGYEVKINDKRNSSVDLIVTSMIYTEKRKVKTDMAFCFDLEKGTWNCNDKKFIKDEDQITLPETVASYTLKQMGAYYKTLFGFVPTVTSSLSIENIYLLSGYTMYPFNMNFVELQKIAGMQVFKIDRADTQSVKKMYEFLCIKPSKVLRKTYNEYPYAPVIYKFLEQLGFKDPNIINKELKNKTFLAFLKLYWANYNGETGKLNYNGEDALSFFCEKSLEANKEHTVMAALNVCCQTGLLAFEQHFSLLLDTLYQLRENYNGIDENIRKEIFHDGVTTRTHENLISYFQHTRQQIDESKRKEPFNYSVGDQNLEWMSGWYKMPKTQKEDDGTEKIVTPGIPEYEFQIPKNEHELIEFGKHMHNCVGWGFYTEKVRSHRCNIVAVYHRKEPFICVELEKIISPSSERRRIVQALGPCNSRLTNEQLNILAEWATVKHVEKNGYC